MLPPKQRTKSEAVRRVETPFPKTDLRKDNELKRHFGKTFDFVEADLLIPPVLKFDDAGAFMGGNPLPLPSPSFFFAVLSFLSKCG